MNVGFVPYYEKLAKEEAEEAKRKRKVSIWCQYFTLTVTEESKTKNNILLTYRCRWLETYRDDFLLQHRHNIQLDKQLQSRCE